MTKRWAVALLPLACLTLAGCKLPTFGKPKAPTGQVVATLNGREVTVRDLQAEMGNATFPDANARKAAERGALDQILGRMAVADAARQQGIDKTPEFALQKDRVVDLLLAQMLQNKVVTSVPPPTREQANAYIAEHPEVFAQHTIWTVDTIRFPNTNDPSLIQALTPLKTLQQVKSLLDSKHIPYASAAGAVDTAKTNPRLEEAVAKDPSEAVIVPGQPMTAFQVTGSNPAQAITGDDAINYATAVLKQEHAQAAWNTQLGEILPKAKANLQLNKTYQLPAGTGAGAAAAPPAAANS